MIYRVLANETEMAEANGRWLYARSLSPDYDCCLGVPVDPQITNSWDYGKVMLDGRIACQVPSKFADEFGGVEIDLTESDFPEETGEI